MHFVSGWRKPVNNVIQQFRDDPFCTLKIQLALHGCRADHDPAPPARLFGPIVVHTLRNR